MKAVQINGYSKQIHTVLREIPQPQISDFQVLIQVKAAAVNPLELLILTGSVKLIQDYEMPLTLGNECSGIVVQVGSKVTGFQRGDRVTPVFLRTRSAPSRNTLRWTRTRLQKYRRGMTSTPPRPSR